MAVKVTVVERFKQESMNELFVYWDEKGADVERWPLVEVRLSYILLLYGYSNTHSLVGFFLVMTEHRVMGSYRALLARYRCPRYI